MLKKKKKPKYKTYAGCWLLCKEANREANKRKKNIKTEENKEIILKGTHKSKTIAVEA